MRDRIPEHSELWRGRWERMTEKLNDAEGGALGWDRNLNWARGLIVLSARWRIGAAVLFRARRGGAVAAGRRVGLVNLIGLSSLSATRFKRLDPGHVQRVERWQAFERWTEELPPPLRRPSRDAGAVESGSSSTAWRSARPSG